MGSLNAGPYTNNPDSGEQLFDAGSLAIARGDRPFLVNATGQLYQGSNKPDDFIYNDNFGAYAARGLYNVFYTDKPTPLGQGADTRADGARTHLELFDQTGVYVFMRANYLEDMYPRTSTKATISSWIRDVICLRPNLFIVYDRSTVTDSAVGQWIRFHFAGVPVKVIDASPGITRYDIGRATTYAGTVISLLPISHREHVTPTIFPDSNVSRLGIQPNTPTAENRWLTVFDAAATAAEAAHARLLSTEGHNVPTGAIVGVLLQSSAGSFAYISGVGPAGTTVNAPIRYRLPTTVTLNVICDLTPNSAYAVKAVPTATEMIVDIALDSGAPTNKLIHTSQSGVQKLLTPTS